MNKLIYGGIDLRTFGLYVSGSKTFSSPTKEYDKVSIPGRSGDLIRFNYRYSNVELEYDAILIPLNPAAENLRQQFRNQAESVRAALLSKDGYVKIEDDYNPEEYRMGVFEGPFDIEAIMLYGGETTLTFNCKPQRWLVSGDEPTRYIEDGYDGVSNSFEIVNPTLFSSKPIIAVSGDGDWSFQIEDESGKYHGEVTINDVPSGAWSTKRVIFDCETMDCALYNPVNGTYENWNSHTEFDEVPTLPPGTITVHVSRNNGSSTGRVEVTPRWFTL